MAKESRRHNITGTAQYLVVDVMKVEMGTSVEEVVRNGAMLQTPTPPTKRGRKLGAADRPVAKEVGWHRRNNGLGIGIKYS